jgi:hypothetical protein
LKIKYAVIFDYDTRDPQAIQQKAQLIELCSYKVGFIRRVYTYVKRITQKDSRRFQKILVLWKRVKAGRSMLSQLETPAAVFATC